MISLIKNYFNKVQTYSTPRFVVELTLVCFILKFISVFVAAILFTGLGIPTETDSNFEEGLIKGGWFLATFLVIIFAAFETLTGQWLMIWLVSKFTKRNFWKILISAIVFSALHIEPILIAGVFPIGLLLAWTFIVRSERELQAPLIIKRKKSRAEAFWVTTAIHVLHNLVVLWMVSKAI